MYEFVYIYIHHISSSYLCIFTSLNTLGMIHDHKILLVHVLIYNNYCKRHHQNYIACNKHLQLYLHMSINNPVTEQVYHGLTVTWLGVYIQVIERNRTVLPPPNDLIASFMKKTTGKKKRSALLHCCDQCSYKTNNSSNLKEHKQARHNIDLTSISLCLSSQVRVSITLVFGSGLV